MRVEHPCEGCEAVVAGEEDKRNGLPRVGYRHRWAVAGMSAKRKGKPAIWCPKCLTSGRMLQRVRDEA